jgi:hypothetical protein
MDESKSETNVKSCGECAIIHYIFHVMYGKIVFAEIYNKSVSINGSSCLISYVNVIVLIIKIQNTIQNKLSGDPCFTRSLCVLCNPIPYSAWPIC